MTEDSVITQEMRDTVGVDSAPLTHDVERGAVIRFAQAIGDSNPLFNDEAAARGTRHGGLIAPPTFLRSIEPPLPHELIRIPYTEVLDGGSEWEFFRPVRVGDRITVATRTVELSEKSGRLGHMLFVVRETRYVDQHGSLVARQRSTYIYYQPSDQSGERE